MHTNAIYRLVGQHSDYYRCGLQFLGCSIDTYPKDQWAQQAFCLGLAALLGEGIYNIGELVRRRRVTVLVFTGLTGISSFQLAHPILESLNGTENEWLVELLRAFNSGDIVKFEQMKPKWSSIADLLQ